MSGNQVEHSCIKVMLYPLMNFTGSKTDCVSVLISASGPVCLDLVVPQVLFCPFHCLVNSQPGTWEKKKLNVNGFQTSTFFLCTMEDSMLRKKNARGISSVFIPNAWKECLINPLYKTKDTRAQINLLKTGRILYYVIKSTLQGINFNVGNT